MPWYHTPGKRTLAMVDSPYGSAYIGAHDVDAFDTGIIWMYNFDAYFVHVNDIITRVSWEASTFYDRTGTVRRLTIRPRPLDLLVGERLVDEVSGVQAFYPGPGLAAYDMLGQPLARLKSSGLTEEQKAALERGLRASQTSRGLALVERPFANTIIPVK